MRSTGADAPIAHSFRVSRVVCEIFRCNYRAFQMLSKLNVLLIGTESAEEGPLKGPLLNSGQRWGVDFYGSAMMYKDGWNGLTQAQFDFGSWNGNDIYYLSVVNGFDTPMQIATNRTGPTVTCRELKCADARVNEDDAYEKYHAVPTGGTFTLTFCS
ncbi:hypothetical protein PRIPAC_71668 [Pristionchus pacificus]|uniref:Uncharacterized protein n=1 Tax=Pristionchus pacificus TaxID=54126 RepID=A0A2A6C8F5_PRIPA|nr:hypothetical protein PRIPAC_71668 [Pristionchus pacificus]|eukprot:PDM74464.1 hypothetical protein PRIPAC_41820 [Pristionchus pacificus]